MQKEDNGIKEQWKEGGLSRRKQEELGGSRKE
jgi:hypothetical protein